MISSTVLKAMQAAGCTMDQIIAAIAASEGDAHEKVAAKREADRLRKRRQRDKEKATETTVASDVSRVTIVTAVTAPSPSPAPSPEKETTPPAPPLKKNKPQPVSPSLFGDVDVASDTPLMLESEPAPTKSKKGERLAATWKLNREWGEWALNEFPFLTADAVRQMAEEFRDYWSALPGAKACKLDWFATWRNNVRMKAGRYRGGTAQRARPLTGLAAVTANFVEELQNDGYGSEAKEGTDHRDDARLPNRAIADQRGNR